MALETTINQVVVAHSQATLASGSSAMMASRTASLTWLQILSGWLSVTDSEVKHKCGELMKLIRSIGNDSPLLGLAPAA